VVEPFKGLEVFPSPLKVNPVDMVWSGKALTRGISSGMTFIPLE
jgi:hypothetical protein